MTRNWKTRLSFWIFTAFFSTQILGPVLLAPGGSETSFYFENSARAETTDSGSGPGKAACADIPDGQGEQAAGTTGTTSGQPPQMKKHYCDAARNEEKAGGKNKAFGAVYLAVGSICLMACINKFGGPMLEKACTYSLLGASVAEGIFTKNFLGPVMGAMPLVMDKFGGGGAASGGSTDGEPIRTSVNGSSRARRALPNQEKSKGRNKSACFSCAMAFALAAMKFLSANKSKDRAEENYTEAAKYPSPETPNFTTAGVGSDGSSTQGNSTGSGSGNSSTSASTSGASSTGTQDRTSSEIPGGGNASGGGANTIRDPNTPGTPPVTGDVCTSGSTEQILSCAIAADPSLSETLNNPDFGRAFQEASGIPLGDFLRNPGKDMGEAFGRATGGGLGGAAEPLKSTLEKLADPKINLEEVGSQYTGGGGGGGSSKGAADDGGLGDAFKNLMSGLAGGANREANRSPASGKSLYADGRDPAHDEVFNNRSISLFERVTHRMKKVTPRSLENLPPATPYNQAVNRK